jgi:hypothetical protein
MQDPPVFGDPAVESLRNLFQDLLKRDHACALLAQEGIAHQGTAASVNGELLVPMVDAKGKLQNLQTITLTPDNDLLLERRLFIQDRGLDGLRHVIGNAASGDPVLVTTHYETAARIHAATAHPCVVGFRPANIPALLAELRHTHPNSPIVWVQDTASPQPEAAKRATQGIQVHVAQGAPTRETDPQEIKTRVSQWIEQAQAIVPRPSTDQPSPEEAPATRGRISPDEREPDRQIPLPKAEQLMQELLREFRRIGNQYFWPGEDKKLAFTDEGGQIATAHEDADVARGMAKLAKAKGWLTIRLEGTPDFQRRAWVEAHLLQLNTTGYEPDEYDRSELQRRLQVHTADSQISTPSDAATPRPGPPARQEPELTIQPSREGRKPGLLAKLRQELLRMQQEGPDLEATLRYAQTLLTQKRAYLGELIAHGVAPYRNDPGQAQSYFVTLRHQGKDAAVWGVDLARSFSETSAPQIGDTILLAFQGNQPVEISDPADPNKPITVHRSTWCAKTLRSLCDEALGPVLSGDPDRDTRVIERALQIKGIAPELRQQVHQRLARVDPPRRQPPTAGPAIA